MKGGEAANALRPVLAMLRARDEVTATEVVAAVSFALGIETLSMKRSRAGRSGGLASVESRRTSDGSAQPKQTRSKPYVASWQETEANLKQPTVASEPNLPRPPVSPTPPSSPLAPSDSGAASVISSDSGTVGSAGPREARAGVSAWIPLEPVLNDEQPKFGYEEPPRDWSKRPPRNLDEAREMPLEPRAKRVLAAPFDAQFLQPDQWPEVRLAAAAFRAAVGKPRMPLGRYDSDAGVKRLVELYAAGLTAEDVCGAIPVVVASDWFRTGAPKDLGSLSLTVVRRALDARPAAPTLEGLPRQMFGG